MSEPVPVPERAIFQRWPSLRTRLAFTPLAALPTPLDEIEIAHGNQTRTVLVKRDDISSPDYGGNKVRKLEFILGRAQALGATRVITAGAAGSHHALATTVHARTLGMRSTLVLFPQHRTEHVRETLLANHALGAELRFTRRMEGVPYALWRARREHAGETTHLIAPGGSDAYGTLGYVSAALELAGQLQADGRASPSVIHVAAGTLGTVAGIAIGLAAAGLHIPIVGSRITSRIVANRRALTRLVRATLNVLKTAGTEACSEQAALSMIDLRDEQLGAGYGHGTPEGEAAIAAFAAAGLQLDITYTAKAAAALLSEPQHSTAPLFWLTFSAHMPKLPAPGGTAENLPPEFVAYLHS